MRDLAAEGMFEYGSRCGIWRVFRAFGTRELCATAFTCALAVERVRGVVFRVLSSIFFFPLSGGGTLVMKIAVLFF